MKTNLSSKIHRLLTIQSRKELLAIVCILSCIVALLINVHSWAEQPIAWCLLVISSVVLIFALVNRFMADQSAIALKKYSSGFQDTFIRTLPARGRINFWRISALLFLICWLGIWISTIVIKPINGAIFDGVRITLFELSFIGMVGSVIYYVLNTYRIRGFKKIHIIGN